MPYEFSIDIIIITIIICRRLQILRYHLKAWVLDSRAVPSPKAPNSNKCLMFEGGYGPFQELPGYENTQTQMLNSSEYFELF